MIVRKVGQGMIVRLVGIRIPGYEPGIRDQVAAYAHILEEFGYEVRQTRLLRIGQTPDEGFEEIVLRKELNRK